METSSKIKLINAAINSIYKSGLHSVTTAKIAKKADLSEAMIYKNFTNKKELISESFLFIKKNLNDYVAAKSDKEGTFIDICFNIWDGYLNYFILNPSHLSVINQIENSKYYTNDLSKKCLSLNDFSTSVFSEGVKSNIFEDIDIEVAKALFFTPILSIAESINLKRLNDSPTLRKSIFNRAIKSLLK